MKPSKSKAELFAEYTSISALVEPLCIALEVANRSDAAERHENDKETGNLPNWAGSAFNPVFAVVTSIIKDKFGVSLQHDVQVNWGGNGSFYQDIFEAIVSALVPLLRDVASETKNTKTGKIAKIEGIWYSVNAGYSEREFEIRFALPDADLALFGVANDYPVEAKTRHAKQSEALAATNTDATLIKLFEQLVEVEGDIEHADSHAQHGSSYDDRKDDLADLKAKINARLVELGHVTLY